MKLPGLLFVFLILSPMLTGCVPHSERKKYKYYHAGAEHGGTIPDELRPKFPNTMIPGEQQLLSRIGRMQKQYGKGHEKVHVEIAKLIEVNRRFARHERAVHLSDYLVRMSRKHAGQTHPRTGLALLQRGEAHASNSNYDKADKDVAEATDILEMTAGSSSVIACRAYILAATIEFDKGNLRLAEKKAADAAFFLESVEEGRDVYVSAMLVLANIDICEFKFESALQRCALAAKANPESASVYHVSAMIEYLRGNFQQTVKYLGAYKQLADRRTVQSAFLDWMVHLRLGQREAARQISKAYYDDLPAYIRARDDIDMIRFIAGEASEQELLEAAAFSAPLYADSTQSQLSQAFANLLLAIDRHTQGKASQAQDYLQRASALGEQGSNYVNGVLYQIERDRIGGSPGVQDQNSTGPPKAPL